MQNEFDSPDEWEEEEPYYDWDDPDWREDWDDVEKLRRGCGGKAVATSCDPPVAAPR